MKGYHNLGSLSRCKNKFFIGIDKKVFMCYNTINKGTSQRYLVLNNILKKKINKNIE